MWINSVFSRFDCGRWMAFFGNHVGATALNSYTQKFVTRTKRPLYGWVWVFTVHMCYVLCVNCWLSVRYGMECGVWSLEHGAHHIPQTAMSCLEHTKKRQTNTSHEEKELKRNRTHTHAQNSVHSQWMQKYASHSNEFYFILFEWKKVQI